MGPIRCAGAERRTSRHLHPRHSWRLTWALAVAMALSAPLGARDAAAQEADDLDTASMPQRTLDDRAAGAASGPGAYRGLNPGEAASRKPRRPDRLTWVGFQPKDDGTSTLFLQLSSEVPFAQEVTNGKLVVKLEGARYGNPNTRRRLDTRFFEGALQQVTSKAVSRRRARRDQPERTAGIELTISFKNPADAGEARAEMRQEEDGFHYLYLNFGAPGVQVSPVQ
jgi:hypothetical protein